MTDILFNQNNPGGASERLVDMGDGTYALRVATASRVVTWAQTSVTLAAATSTTLIAANSSRKALRWMNVGTNPMTVVPGAGPAVVGTGMQYSGAYGTGEQGGADDFTDETSTQQFTAISTLGTTVIIWEGT